MSYFSLPGSLGQDGEIFVAARFAAIGRDRQPAPKECETRANMLGGDALQFVIAAQGAMSMKRIAKGH